MEGRGTFHARGVGLRHATSTKRVEHIKRNFVSETYEAYSRAFGIPAVYIVSGLFISLDHPSLFFETLRHVSAIVNKNINNQSCLRDLRFSFWPPGTESRAFTICAFSWLPITKRLLDHLVQAPRSRASPCALVPAPKLQPPTLQRQDLGEVSTNDLRVRMWRIAVTAMARLQYCILDCLRRRRGGAQLTCPSELESSFCSL